MSASRLHLVVCSALPGLAEDAVRRCGARLAVTVVDHTLADEGLPTLIEEKREVFEAADILLADPGLVYPFLRLLPNLRWMQSTWAGVEPIVKTVQSTSSPSKRYAPGYTLTRFVGPMGATISNYVVCAILQRERFFERYLEHQAAKVWQPQGRAAETYRSESDLTVAILGVGAIGKCVARSLKGLGIGRVTGVVRQSRAPDEVCDEYFDIPSLDTALASADYVVTSCPAPLSRRACFQAVL